MNFFLETKTPSVVTAARLIPRSTPIQEVIVSGGSGVFTGKASQRVLNIVVLTLIVVVNFVFSGPTGLLVLFCSSTLGLACHFLEVKKSVCMSALVVPTILVLTVGF